MEWDCRGHTQVLDLFDVYFNTSCEAGGFNRFETQDRRYDRDRLSTLFDSTHLLYHKVSLIQ